MFQVPFICQLFCFTVEAKNLLTNAKMSNLNVQCSVSYMMVVVVVEGNEFT